MVHSLIAFKKLVDLLKSFSLCVWITLCLCMSAVHCASSFVIPSDPRRIRTLSKFLRKVNNATVACSSLKIIGLA